MRSSEKETYIKLNLSFWIAVQIKLFKLSEFIKLQYDKSSILPLRGNERPEDENYSLLSNQPVGAGVFLDTVSI